MSSSEALGLELEVKEADLRLLYRLETILGQTGLATNDANVFMKVVHYALTVGRLPREVVAERLKVSLGTVSRWAYGKNVPHELSRDVVVSSIISLVRERRESLKQEVDELREALVPPPDEDEETGRKFATG